MSLIGTMDSGVSALRSFTKGLEVIGNNIANVNTTGFKGASASYADSFSNILQQASPSADTNTVAIGTGVQLSGINTDFSQGSLSSTGKSTDLGVSGNGFFTVKDPSSGASFVTRAGDFNWDASGYLVTTQGYRVQGLTGGSAGTPPATLGDIKQSSPAAGAAQIQSVAIDSAGNVIESYSDGTTATTNTLLLQDFKNPSALTPEGNNLYTGMSVAGPTNGSATLLTDGTNNPATNGLGRIQAGVLELSNVDLTQQFSNLITTQRSFEAGSRLLTVSDTLLEDIVNLKQR